LILIVSYPNEGHTVDVVNRLKNAGREVRILNLSDFPGRSKVSLSWSEKFDPKYQIDGPDGICDLSTVRVGWWRRVVPFEIDPGIRDAAQRAFAENETSQAINGVLDAIDCTWVNPRCADESAHRKPLQWDVARRIGLTLPQTLVTNDPDAGRNFIEKIGIGKTVFKAFLAIIEDWRETRLIKPQDLDRLESLRYAPVIFQEYIEGVDLRIIVVGDRIYAAEIDARKTSYPVDMRMVIGEASMKPIELPSYLQDMILRFMRSLGLVYGAIDMRRTAEGDFVFLEVNPAGQWLFVEERTGQPISQAVADLLSELHDEYV
jgi:glutathione synthase/RimK-type ligase-like ATP-grasp enzyme